MKQDGRRSSSSLQQFHRLLAGRDDDKGGHPVVRTIGTVSMLVVLGLLVLQTLAGRLIEAWGLPKIPLGWLMGAFIVISTIWVGAAAWHKRRTGRGKD